MTPILFRRAPIVALACLLLAPVPSPRAHARQPAPPVQAGTAASQADQDASAVNPEELPPQIVLGLKSASVAKRLPTLATVVIVRDASSYAEAIAGWTRTARYPVLLDDGSHAARERIARFVRAFQPQRVVRFDANAAWPNTRQSRRDRVEAAVARAWELDPDTFDAGTAWNTRFGITPFGVVVSDDLDPAWTAALALAAGRAQPIVWVETTRNLNGAFTSQAATTLNADIQRACNDGAIAWLSAGDVDAITLALNCPSKVAVEPGEHIATTDLIGRGIRFEDGRLGASPTRWAWASQVPGDESAAAYRAMCSLFLTPGSAWLWDAYINELPWTDWHPAPASERLRQRGLSVEIIDGPSAAVTDWRARATRPLAADVIAVNTKGNPDHFELDPGWARPGDVPVLDRPAAVYLVHSWSCTQPGARWTLGGRWLDHGAFALLGSVQEPGLQAFVPTPTALDRLSVGGAWGASVRLDPSEAWRIACFGDPLWTLAGPGERTDTALPIPGVTDLLDEMRDAVRGQRFVDAVDTLVLLGRDDDALRLAMGVVQDRPEQAGPALAAAAVMPAFRAGTTDQLLELYAMLDSERAKDHHRRDALWLRIRPELATTSDQRMVTLAMANVRHDQRGVDGRGVSAAVTRVFGRDRTRAFLGELQKHVNRRTQNELLTRTINELN